MARFTAPVPLRMKWNGLEISGAVGVTHRIPDEYVEEFTADVAPVIPGGVTWISQDESTAIPVLPITEANVTGLVADLAGKFDKTGGIISGSVTATASIRSRDIGGVIYADQYSSIQAAINALPASGGRVFISGGAYTVGTAASTAPGLTYPVGDSTGFSFELIGAGAGATKITYVGTGWAVDTSAATASIASQMVMQGISFVGTTAALSGGLRLKNVHRSKFRDLQIQDFNGAGAWAVVVDGSGGASFGAHHNLIEGCDFSGCTNGIKLTGAAGAGQSNANRILGNRVAVSVVGGTGVLMDIGDTNVILGNSIFTNAASCTGAVIGGDRNMFGYNRLEASTSTGTIGVSVRSDATQCAVGPMTAASFGTESVDSGVGTDINVLRSTNGGRRVPVATFTIVDVPATAALTVVPLAGTTAAGSTLWVPLLNASVAGISWRWSAVISAGTYTVHITRGGVSQQNTGSQTARNGAIQYVPGLLTCTPAQSLGIEVETSSTFSPTTNDLTVFLWAYA